ncbi:hypothetical protein CRG98_035610 [Punica granatum]|uniref:Apple domain-containing protein n=1 Tax=Punica granatum TaxID=22663 RepID=A0A2I0IJ58_PUNGR|nr:hypothetical protein CRG98_035610 [Punica granatum]
MLVAEEKKKLGFAEHPKQSLQFLDGSEAGSVLEIGDYGCGFYYNDGGHFFTIFYLRCSKYRLNAVYPVDCSSQSPDGCTGAKAEIKVGAETDSFCFFNKFHRVWSAFTFLQYFSMSFSDLSLDSSSYVEFRSGSLVRVSSSNGINFSVFSFTASISQQFIRLSSDGQLKVYEWRENQWQEIASLLTWEIGDSGNPLLCGEYGVCSNGQCTCPASRNPSGTPYFKQLVDRNRSLRCPLTTPLSCDDPQNQIFVKLEKFTYFTVSKQDVSNTSLESCQEACARNCSCKAAFYSPSRSYCSLQAQNISSEISPSPLPPPPPSNPTTDTDSCPARKANCLPLILGPALGSLILLMVALVLFIWKRRAADEADEEYLDEVQGMPTRFPYNELKSATENFCKKIGEGGYGSVFPGTLADGTKNILLDENLSANDFGLSKLVERDKSRLVTTVRGTPGYIASEWLSGVITEKADVYSFGVVALEIACGWKVFDSSQSEEDRFLLHLLKGKAEEDRLLDIVNNYRVDMQLYGPEVANMIKLAAWCLQADYTKRPYMSMVVQVLDGVIEVEDNLDFNFWNRPVTAGPGRNRAGAPSALPLTWTLSGPR